MIQFLEQERLLKKTGQDSQGHGLGSFNTYEPRGGPENKEAYEAWYQDVKKKIKIPYT